MKHLIVILCMGLCFHVHVAKAQWVVTRSDESCSGDHQYDQTNHRNLYNGSKYDFEFSADRKNL